MYVKHISLFLLNVEEYDFCDFRQNWLLQSLYSFSPLSWSPTTLIYHHHEDAAWIQDLSWITGTEAERIISYLKTWDISLKLKLGFKIIVVRVAAILEYITDGNYITCNHCGNEWWFSALLKILLYCESGKYGSCSNCCSLGKMRVCH